MSDHVLIGVAAAHAKEGEKVDVIVTGGAIYALEPEGRSHVGTILGAARAFGISIPDLFVFDSGQVFYKDRQIEEIRLAGLVLASPDPKAKATPWSITRTSAQSTSDPPRLSVLDGGWLSLDPSDTGRTHISAKAVTDPDGGDAPVLSMLWDLRGNQTSTSRVIDTGQLSGALAEARAQVVRMPHSIAVAWTAIRAGETKTPPQRFIDPTGRTFPVIDGLRHWVFVAPRGSTLLLPFPDAVGVTVERSGVLAREVLGGGLLLAYLTTWALWNLQGDPTGLFLADPAQVAELRGFRAYAREKWAPRYGKAMDDFRSGLSELTLIGLAGVGDVSAKTAEPLIQEYRKGPGRRMYRHAPLALSAIVKSGDFAQLPVAVLRLPARDAPLAAGIASLWRDVITRDVFKGAGHWRGGIRELLQRIGCFNANEARKHGRAYWRTAAEDLQRVMVDGELGTIAIEGEGNGATVTLEPSPVLATVYRPLLDAQAAAAERYDRATFEAEVRKKLPRKSRKGPVDGTSS